MDDDLNTAGALAAIFDLVTEMNRVADDVQKGQIPAAQARPGLSTARATFLELAGLLGLALAAAPIDQRVHQKVREIASKLAAPDSVMVDTEKLIFYILEEREKARARRDFSAADRIRHQLADAGVIVEDSPTGPRWRLAPVGA